MANQEQVDRLKRSVKEWNEWRKKNSKAKVDLSGISLVNAGLSNVDLSGANLSQAKKGKRRRQKTGLNRSILDVGWGMMRGMLQYKEAEAGGVYLEAPTQQLKPSQRCPQCWSIKPKELSERMRICPCGCTEDRDVASAQVCLIWARGIGTILPTDADHSGSTSSPKERKSCGGMKQLVDKKRQKPPLQAKLSGV